jgi:hypothetical protein
MARKTSNSRHKAYRDRDTGRSGQTGNINARNNNQDVDASPPVSANEEPNVNPDNREIGDSTRNNDKLTKYTSNHSADA